MKSNTWHCIGIVLAMIGLMMLKPATADETSWSCWHHDTNIHCVPSFNPPPDEMKSPYRRALNDSRQVDFQDSGKWIIIPLHSEPRNWSRVQLLVESVMCGSTPDCAVELNQTPMNTALLNFQE